MAAPGLGGTIDLWESDPHPRPEPDRKKATVYFAELLLSEQSRIGC
jgi:hypothetical protein